MVIKKNLKHQSLENLIKALAFVQSLYDEAVRQRQMFSGASTEACFLFNIFTAYEEKKAYTILDNLRHKISEYNQDIDLIREELDRRAAKESGEKVMKKYGKAIERLK